MHKAQSKASSVFWVTSEMDQMMSMFMWADSAQQLSNRFVNVRPCKSLQTPWTSWHLVFGGTGRLLHLKNNLFGKS